MSPWTPNPALVAQLLAHSPRENSALRRRVAVLNVLDRYSFTPWQKIVQLIEEELGAGVFGNSPQARVWSDMRALRDAGIVIGYSRIKGIEGYYLRLAMASEAIQTVIRQVARELDVEHLKRIRQLPPAKRIDAMFEMITFGVELAEAGRRTRERQAS